MKRIERDLRKFNGKHTSGEGNPNHKLTLETVRKIRNEYKEGTENDNKITYRKLAERYNTSASTIGYIITNKTWIESKNVSDSS